MAEILDACCGGRHWWWDKDHPLAVYMDKREASPGSIPHRPNWSCAPDIVGDFRAMPFADEQFRLVLFDPPHIVRPNPSGNIVMTYGALRPDEEQDDLMHEFQPSPGCHKFGAGSRLPEILACSERAASLRRLCIRVGPSRSSCRLRP